MKKTLIGMLMVTWLGGCAASVPPVVSAPDAGAVKTVAAKVDAPAEPSVVAASDQPSRPANGPWIGAAGASDFVLAGTTDTVLGVWVDVPSASKKTHAPAAVSLVIDVSGSMAGAKIENARASAHALVEKLADGDIVSILTFSDEARERVPPTVLNQASRSAIFHVIDGLEPLGGTNLFDGLRLGESRAFTAPGSHPVRRVVVISDGIANVGPSTPEVLGELAARGAGTGVQVTALGVGLDYDENTLNALAIRSSGRLYHIGEPREMSAMLESELGLLQATAATEASIEVVPAPGVQLLGADGVRADWAGNGALRFPLGTMFGGQHREMAIRVRVTAQADGTHPLASVRFHFHDPLENNLDRVQEVVARYQVTGDRLAVDQHQNAKTQNIVATMDASKAALSAAQQLNNGDFAKADQDLAVAETKLRASATHAATKADEQRALVAVAQISKARKDAQEAAAAPPAAKPAAMRARALDVNSAAMKASGF